MKQHKGSFDGVAAFFLAVQVYLSVVFVCGWATGADLPYGAMAVAEFLCCGFVFGWMFRRGD